MKVEVLQKSILYDLSRSNIEIPLKMDLVDFSISDYASLDLYNQLACSLGNWLDVPKSYFLFGNGTAELIDTITSIIHGEKVVIFSPTFFLYEKFALKYGKTPILLDWAWNETHPYMNTIRDASIIWIANPNNPTNNHLDSNTLLDIINNTNGTVVIDENYIEFSSTSFCKYTSEYKNLIVLRSFSKSFGIAGARLGYIISSPNLLNLIAVNKDPISANRICIEIALNILKEYIPIYKIKWSEVTKVLNKMSDILLCDNFNILKGMTSFLTLKFDTHKFAKLFSDIGKANGLLFKNGSDWEFSGDSKCLVRVAVPPEKDQELIFNKLNKIKNQFINEFSK